MNKATAFAKRRPGLTGTLGAMAAMAVAFGGYAASACTCITPVVTTTTTTTTTTPPASANIKVATTGNDSTCTRHATEAITAITDPCATFDKANSIAINSDVVAVMGGDYPRDGSRLDSNPNSIAGDALLLVNNNSRTTDATFVCGDGVAVTTPAQFLLMVTQHVKITGDCFNFHKVMMGDYVTGYFPINKTCTNQTIDAAHMQMFDILGPCNNDTISNNTIGPSVACHASGSAICKNNGTGTFGTPTYTGEQYYRSRGIGNDNCCTEPKVHAGGPNPCGCILPQNVVITGNSFYGFSSRDPDGSFGGEIHAGCLWTGDGVQSITITNNTFAQCMTYMILMNDSSTHDDIENNTMSVPKDAMRLSTDFSAIIDEPGFQSIQSKCSGGPATVTDIIKSNTGMSGWYLDPTCGNTYSGTIINGNTAATGVFTAGQNPNQPFSS